MKPLVRVTQLEQFRKWWSGRYAYVTEQDVIDTITGEFKGNDKTHIGSAFHHVVECGGDMDGVTPILIRVDGVDVWLGMQHYAEALNYRAEFPTAFHEVRACKDYDGLVVTGCADIIDGLEIRDIKTRFTPCNTEEYADSYQWRLYLDIFGAHVFHYDVFEVVGYNDTMGTMLVNTWLRRYEPITLLPYPRMGDHIRGLISDFRQWVDAKGIALPQIMEEETWEKG